ncbi:MAG: phytanoyl-CoA dioxygenase family protein [Phycisphaeraceae bacterium]
MSITDHDLFMFDLRGYQLFPSVLSAGEIAELKDFLEIQRTDPESLPREQRTLPGGPTAKLIDHPVVMEFLTKVIAKRDKIRLEKCDYFYRERGQGGWNPHAGGRTLHPNYAYNYHNGIYAGMTRLVWELNEVELWKGGTAFMPGSHKANLPFSDEVDRLPETDVERYAGAWNTYACPPGSLLIFSEATRHSSVPWQMDHPRMAIFSLYNHIQVRHNKPCTFDPPVIEALSPEHRMFFRDVYYPGFDHPDRAAICTPSPAAAAATLK